MQVGMLLVDRLKQRQQRFEHGLPLDGHRSGHCPCDNILGILDRRIDIGLPGFEILLFVGDFFLEFDIFSFQPRARFSNVSRSNLQMLGNYSGGQLM